jgi:hypothetical protein
VCAGMQAASASCTAVFIVRGVNQGITCHCAKHASLLQAQTDDTRVL